MFRKEWADVVVLICIFIGAFVWLSLIIVCDAYVEEPETYTTLIATGSNVNCRMAANKHSYIVTELERGQTIQSTGRWSKDHQWIEIDHPEHGRLWCNYQFLTERTDSFLVETLWNEPIKIRKVPFNGKVKGYLRKGRTLEITQVIFGWGKCKQGWIDLEYCIEIEE